MLYIYITFYLNGSGEVNVMKIVNGTRASSDGIINSLRSRPSAARFARINTFTILQLANLAYKACLKELVDHWIKANACGSQIVQL